MKIENTPSLEFVADAKNILNAISRVHTLNQSIDCMDNDRKMILLCCKRGKKAEAFIVGLTPDSFAMQQLDASVASEGIVVFDVATVNGLLKGRSEVKISCDNNQLLFAETKSKYKAKTEFEEADSVLVKRIISSSEMQKAKKLSFDVIEAIRGGVRCAELTNFYSDEVILAYITVNEKGVRVDCADNFHIASYQHKVKADHKFRMAIPVKTFTLIDKFIGESDVKFSTTETHLRVEGPEFIIIMPATQIDSSMYSIVPNYLKGLTDPLVEFNLDSAALKITDNIFAIITEDTKMSMAVSKKSVKINMNTRNGSVSDSFKVAAKGKEHIAHIDPKIFGDLIKRVSGDEVPFAFFDGSRGTTGCFRITSHPNKSARLTQIGTFYAE